jgi:hypothetical protein
MLKAIKFLTFSRSGIIFYPKFKHYNLSYERGHNYVNQLHEGHFFGRKNSMRPIAELCRSPSNRYFLSTVFQLNSKEI